MNTITVLAVILSGALAVPQTGDGAPSACGAPADSAQPVCGGPGGPPAGECVVTADGPVEVPFRVLNNHVLIPVSVNGSAPIELILDTGMPVYGVMLHPGPEVDAIEFDTEGAPMVMVAGGGEGPARAAVNVTLGLPGVEFKGQLAIFAPPPGAGCNESSPEAAKGVIGLAIFDNFVVTFDHERNVLVLTRPDDFTYTGRGARLPFRLGDPPVPEIDCAIDADGQTVPLTLTVDTGASHNLSITLAPDTDIAPPAGARELVVGYSMWGELTGLIGRGGTLRLGNLALDDVLVTYLQKGAQGVPPCGRSGLLGNGVLRRFNVTFDYSRKEMILEPTSHTAKPFEFNMSGMASTRKADGTYSVSRVFPETPAAEAGVLAGDTIVAVDGTPATDIATEELRRLLERDGATISLDIARDGRLLNVALRLRRLV